MVAELRITIEQDEVDERITILDLSGSLDGATFIDFEAEVSQLIDEQKRIHLIFDLSMLEYIASAGVSGFINLQNVLDEHGGFLYLAAPSSAVSQVFSILGLQAIFNVHQSRTAAIDEARQHLAEAD